MFSRAWLVPVTIAIACQGARAQQQVCYTSSIPLQPTNWSASVSFPLFDPALGTLQQIGFTLDGITAGAVRIENLDGAPIVAQVQFATSILLQRPNMSVIAVSNPTSVFTQSLSGFDGTIDFAGTSGFSVFPTSTQSVQANSPLPTSDLALFTGSGTISLPVMTMGGTSIAAGANSVSMVNQNAGATVTVCYTYQPNGSAAVPYCFGDGSSTACPCGNVGAAGNGCANSVNAAGATLSSGGSASISADSFILHGSGMPDSAALYFQGTTQIDAVFGDGKRCAGGTIIRLGTKLNSGGASQYPSGAQPTISVRGMNSAGAVRDYQVWYRNAAPAFCTASTFNLTNGVNVTWLP